MNIDFTTAQMTSEASSQKLVLEGSGTFTTAYLPSSGEVLGGVTIPHGQGTDRLLFQVSTSTDLAGTVINAMAPWQSGDGRVTIWATIDSANLYIYRLNTTFSDFPATTVKYVYKILIP